MKGKKEKANH